MNIKYQKFKIMVSVSKTKDSRAGGSLVSEIENIFHQTSSNILNLRLGVN